MEECGEVHMKKDSKKEEERKTNLYLFSLGFSLSLSLSLFGLVCPSLTAVSDKLGWKCNNTLTTVAILIITSWLVSCKCCCRCFIVGTKMWDILLKAYLRERHEVDMSLGSPFIYK